MPKDTPRYLKVDPILTVGTLWLHSLKSGDVATFILRLRFWGMKDRDRHFSGFIWRLRAVKKSSTIVSCFSIPITDDAKMTMSSANVIVHFETSPHYILTTLKRHEYQCLVEHTVKNKGASLRPDNQLLPTHKPCLYTWCNCPLRRQLWGSSKGVQ